MPSRMNWSKHVGFLNEWLRFVKKPSDKLAIFVEVGTYWRLSAKSNRLRLLPGAVNVSWPSFLETSSQLSLKWRTFLKSGKNKLSASPQSCSTQFNGCSLPLYPSIRWYCSIMRSAIWCLLGVWRKVRVNILCFHFVIVVQLWAVPQPKREWFQAIGNYLG